MEKARSGSFEVRDAATQKLLCLFGSGRSPNSMVQYVVTSVSYLKTMVRSPKLHTYSEVDLTFESVQIDESIALTFSRKITSPKSQKVECPLVVHSPNVYIAQKKIKPKQRPWNPSIVNASGTAKMKITDNAVED